MFHFGGVAIVLALTTVLIGCSETERHVPKDALRLSIELSKSQYPIGESILVKTTFQNVSNMPLDLNKEFWAWPNDCELTFEIETASGGKLEKLRTMIRRPDLSRKDFKELRPSERWEYVADLGAFTKIPAIAGTYTIVSTYKNKVNAVGLGVFAWVGETSSNKVNLEIKQAS